MTVDFNILTAPFPEEMVQWRAQSVTKDGTKAMALAYIDARAVEDRLDLACTPINWRDSYVETLKGRIICTLSLRVGEEWIPKSDGAGNTDVEGDKGALSDALKRAAVKWGIGRYLYDMPTPWVPCDSYQKGDKWHWKGWKEDPWKFVRSASVRPAPFPPEHIIGVIERCETMPELERVWHEYREMVANSPAKAAITAAKDARKQSIELMDRAAA